MSRAPGVSVRAAPGAETWVSLSLSRFRATNPDQRSRRAELGLPVDRPVIMTGHQAGFWHPGILSKYIAADRLARAVGGVAAAIVVDHDVVDPLRLEAVRQKANGHLEQAELLLRIRSGGVNLPRLEPPIAERELSRWSGSKNLIEPDREACEAAVAALAHHDTNESLAAQVAEANADLLRPWMSTHQVTAQQLVRAPVWHEFFSMAVEDPAACTHAYNRAVSMHAEAGIPQLFAMAREHRWELPFWLLDTTRGRRPLYAEMTEQPGFDPSLLATKALSLTASVRRGLCDLFIHGTGGAIYDRATDDWIRDWLGEELAPSVSMTADVFRHIPVDAKRDATPDQYTQARWLLHSARHNPALLDGDEASDWKRAMADVISSKPRGSIERLELYRQMHRKLEAMRAEHQSELHRLQREAGEIERGLAVTQFEDKRDWSSILYPAEQLSSLASAIEDLLQAG